MFSAMVTAWKTCRAGCSACGDRIRCERQRFQKRFCSHCSLTMRSATCVSLSVAFMNQGGALVNMEETPVEFAMLCRVRFS